MAVLKEILKECVPFTAQGAAADLYSVADSADSYGLKSYLIECAGEISCIGDFAVKLSIPGPNGGRRRNHNHWILGLFASFG